MTTILKNIFASLFLSQWTVICFGKDFIEKGNRDEVLHAHNLSRDKHQEVVGEFQQRGFLFCIKQGSGHENRLEDCADCLRLYYHCLRGVLVKEYRTVWATTASDFFPIVRQYLNRGESLYMSPEGQAILQAAGTRFLGYGPLQEVSYLAMYDQAMRLGLSDQEANKFSFTRVHIYADFLLLSAVGHEVVANWLRSVPKKL